MEWDIESGICKKRFLSPRPNQFRCAGSGKLRRPERAAGSAPARRTARAERARRALYCALLLRYMFITYHVNSVDIDDHLSVCGPGLSIRAQAAYPTVYKPRVCHRVMLSCGGRIDQTSTASTPSSSPTTAFAAASTRSQGRWG